MNRVALALSTVYLLLSLSGCGGGGGGTTSATSSDQLGLVANFSNAAILAKTPPVNASSYASNYKIKNIFQEILNIFVPNAYANTYQTTNILAYDSNGNPIPNPLTAKKSIYISVAAMDPQKENIYLGIDRHQNQQIYGNSATEINCVLYKVIKSSGKITCLMSANDYDFRGGTTYVESFFDKNNNFITLAEVRSANGLPGSEIQRLIKVDATGNVSTLRNSNTHWAQALVRLGDNSVVLESPIQGSGNSDSLITVVSSSGVIKKTQAFAANASYNVSGGDTSSHINWVGGSLTRIREVNSTFLIESLGNGFATVRAGTDGSIFVLKNDGGLYDYSQDDETPLATLPARIGDYSCSNTIICDSAAVSNQDLNINDTSVIVRTGTGYCVFNRETKNYFCNDLANYPNSKIRAIAIINNIGSAFFEYNNAIYEAKFSLTSSSNVNYNSSSATSVLVSALSTRAPIAFTSAMEVINPEIASQQIGSGINIYSKFVVSFNYGIRLIDLDQIETLVNGAITPSIISLTDYGKKMNVIFYTNSQYTTKSNLIGKSVTIKIPSSVLLQDQTFNSTVSPNTLNIDL